MININEYIDKYKNEVLTENNNNSTNEQEQDIDVIKQNILNDYEFILPIEYNKHNKLTSIVKSDLELPQIINNLYNFSNNNNNNLFQNKLSTIYSTDKKFLKDNQKFTRKYNFIQNSMASFVDEYLEFKSEQNFLSKYQYVQFKRFNYLNSITSFLQILALYNILSPLLSLFAPLLGIIIPYFVLLFKGIHLGFGNYLKLVKKIIINNTIIKGLMNFHKNSLNTNVYTLVSIFFYGMSIYNNIISCYHFINNTEYLINFIDKYGKFINEGRELIDKINNQTDKLKSFKNFNIVLEKYRLNINKMQEIIYQLNQHKEKYLKYGQIGVVLKCNYEIFYNPDFHDTTMFLTYLNNFNICMDNINNAYKQQMISKCYFSKKTKTSIKGMYYLPHIKEQSITNDVSFKKNLIVTGPNASGKTTLIKSSLINLFLSQSIGFGCYSYCKTPIYDYFHSYLNIPDTSNRDSLFQAEARRCKYILDFIEKHKSKKHFCIFDEIYSGTNPQDAVLCATLYLKGLHKHKSYVDYVLTTHYIDICKEFNKDKYTQNKRMAIEKDKDNDDIKYLYKIENGISMINGGYNVLVKLGYSDDILNKE